MPKVSTWVRVLTVAIVVAASVGRVAPTRAEDQEDREDQEDEEMVMKALNPQNLKFEPIPNMPICATAAIVRGDPRWGPAWVYLKLASGCRVPLHWHSANEDLIVISGKGSITMTHGPTLPFVPGAYASLPAKHTHQASCTRTCLLFSIADAAFDIHYVDENGEEITAEEALKRPVSTKKATTKKGTTKKKATKK